jgi:hypothetical protein
VIVVIGSVAARMDETGEMKPAGFTATLALEAAAAGAQVEVVSRLGDDIAGDAVLLGFAQAGVGHVATLRDAGVRTHLAAPADPESLDDDEPEHEEPGATNAPDLDGADVGLALKYLSDYRVIVLAHPSGADVIGEASSSAGWAPAHLIVVMSADPDREVAELEGALVLSADVDAEATARRLGRYAAAVDSGEDLDTAYAVLTGANGES